MDYSEFLENVFGYLYVIVIFGGVPLFFLYLFARDITRKIKRKKRLAGFLRTWKIENPIMIDVGKLIIGLNGFSPWDRPLAIRKVVKMGSRGMDVVIAALDMPYCWTWNRGFDITSQDFAESCAGYFVNAHQFLVGLLVKLGLVHFEELKENLNHPNLNVRLSIISAMGKIGNPLAIELLIPFLNSTIVDEQIGAIISLGELRAKSAVDNIISLLKDESLGIREKGILALVNINDTKALPALVYVAHTDRTRINDRPVQTMSDLAKWAVEKIRKSNPEE